MSLSLRQIDFREWGLSRASTVWGIQGWETHLELPSKHGFWVQVGDSEQNWKGWIHLRSWLEYVAPKLADLATTANVEQRILPWIMATKRPFELPMSQLSYKRLWFGDMVLGSSLPKGAMLRVMSESGPLWLEDIAPVESEESFRVSDSLTWPLRFVIGSSQIRQRLLEQIGFGDVLLIRTAVSEVRCFSKKLGYFQRYEEGIVMESQELQESTDIQNEVETIHNIAQLPVRMEFVLHRTQLSLSELQRIYQGELLPLPTDVERHVEIRVNEALLGYGELVQMDNMLGVEVIEWLSESGNDK